VSRSTSRTRDGLNPGSTHIEFAHPTATWPGRALREGAAFTCCAAAPTMTWSASVVSGPCSH